MFTTKITIAASDLAKAIKKQADSIKLYEYVFKVDNGKFIITVENDEIGGIDKEPVALVEGVDAKSRYAT